MAARVASLRTGEATCQFERPEACATTISFSRWATLRAAAVAMKIPIGSIRDTIEGTARSETHRKTPVDCPFWRIRSTCCIPVARRAIRARPPTIAIRVLNTLLKRYRWNPDIRKPEDGARRPRRRHISPVAGLAASGQFVDD